MRVFMTLCKIYKVKLPHKLSLQYDFLKENYQGFEPATIAQQCLILPPPSGVISTICLSFFL